MEPVRSAASVLSSMNIRKVANMRFMDLAGVSLLILVSAGCGGSSLGDPVPVSGRVLFKGDPVVGAKVSFLNTKEEGGRSASGTTDSSGSFSLTTFKSGDGAIPGEYAITISKFETTGGGGPMDAADPDSLGSDYGAMMSAAASGESAKLGKELLPEKYAKASESGLTRSIVRGDRNEFEFELD